MFIWYQIEDSNAWLRVMESQVKFLEERRKQLFDNLDMCLFKFQKKKINEKLEQIEKELFKQYEKISEEVNIINKLKNAISNNNDITEADDDTLLSYYDLLTYLKFGITFKKVLYKKINREVIYYYDNEGNYIIENKIKELGCSVIEYKITAEQSELLKETNSNGFNEHSIRMEKEL